MIYKQQCAGDQDSYILAGKYDIFEVVLGVNSFRFLFPRIYSGALSMFQYTVTIAINCFGGMDVCNMVYESH